MPSQKIIDGKKFSYSGLLNFADIYKAIKDFWDSKGFSFDEKEHEEKVKDDGSRDITLKWETSKDVTDYVKYKYDFEVNVSGLKKVVVDINGTKKEMDYVEEFSVELNGELETDFSGLFEGKPFHAFLRGLYEKYVVKPEIKSHVKQLVKIGNEFLDMLKEKTASYKFPN